MKLLQLQYFQATCKYGNITKAAESLNVSQPSITMSIRELEAELGINLFHRAANKKITLTQEGHFFLDKIDKLLNEVDSLSEEMRDLGKKRNKIKLGLPIQVGAFFLPLLINEFHAVYPDIQLEVIEGDSSAIMDMLLEDQIDMAVSAADFNNTNLETMVLYQTEICFCIEKSHPFSAYTSISTALACQVPLVLLENHFYTSKKVQERFLMLEISPNAMLHSNQLHTIKNLVRNSGLGTFLLKEAVFYDEDIIAIPLKEPLNVAVGISIKKGRQVYQDSLKMIQFILKEYNMKNEQGH
ncbi:LysR family transcriptional regulator [Lacrimispora amygdalina]|uniref:LysR family transcriptional regulator n=1 Tax=Lacrimispora amygdalina TaxID=253257 RepID=UPI000BE37E31|nr:LysR family transcriptional regulator [Lacrimispora amygdalina]